jgi:hypothetical protein
MRSRNFVLRMTGRIALVVVGALATACGSRADERSVVTIGGTTPVGTAWAGAPTDFALLSRDGRQWVAYYDGDGRLVVASRGGGDWVRASLDERIGWDSHTGIAMALDATGRLHLAANMHRSPLRYYREETVGDVRSLVRRSEMTGADESEVTYPRFLTAADGTLIFAYRSGRVGRGRDLLDAYDAPSGTWHRRFGLLDGGDTRSAYWFGPVRDQGGVDHLAWTWRDSNDAATNHDVCYARGDLARGTLARSDHEPLTLPIAPGAGEVIDPVPPRAGLFNRLQLSLDDEGRPLVTYVKYDEYGSTQLYTARREPSGWTIHRTTGWTARWDFGGPGSLVEEIAFSGPVPWAHGLLGQVVTNRMVAPFAQFRLLEAGDLRQRGDAVRLYPAAFEDRRAPDAGWQVNVSGLDLDLLRREGRQWVLRWESAPANRDRPRADLPHPTSTLEVVELVLNEGGPR